MATYSGLLKQAGVFDFLGFGKKNQNSMPASHYDNRMTQKQVNNTQLGQNAMPANHYVNRQTEATTRGQMGLSPNSDKAQVHLNKELRGTSDPYLRNMYKAQLMDANTPGPHQYGISPYGDQTGAYGPNYEAFMQGKFKAPGYYPFPSYQAPVEPSTATGAPQPAPTSEVPALGGFNQFGGFGSYTPELAAPRTPSFEDVMKALKPMPPASLYQSQPHNL